MSLLSLFFFFFNDTATTEIYTLSLHDALPISPQRLVHYRENWYVDAYCHMREGLRSFAVDAIHDALLRDARAKEISKTELDEHLASGYGIFAGRNVQWATLKFTPQSARWVSAQIWHPKQRARVEKDSTYVLEIPYS